MKKIIFTALILCSFTQLFAATTGTESAANENTNGVDRYAIFIGSNKGGKGREQLLYAGSDAQNFQKTMTEIGGITDSNSYVLIDPTKEKIDETLNQISTKINTSESTAKRSEFIFYYSGHSDENALLLGDVPYDYSTLKAAITNVPSDIHVVILDSCYSGNFIRTKGGQKRKPFLLDDSSVVSGHAYLSSSSDNEYSQESDEIESSYFTNAMITGLRGAADTSGDNKVTLNELYSYAFNDTLSKTESSKAGPQHPNFNITLVGSGDLVLSDISTAEAMLSLSKDAKGKFIIRNAEGKLISEINKVAGQPIYMALPAGQYSAVIIDEYSTKSGIFLLEKDNIYVLDQNSLSSIKRKNNRVRGTTYDEDDILPIDDLEQPTGNRSRRRYESEKLEDDSDDAEILEKPNRPGSSASSTDSDEIKITDFTPDNMSYMHVSVFPGVSITGAGKDFTLFSYGIFGAYDKNVRAAQISSLANISSGSVFGLQASALFNTSKNINGMQDTGLFNISGNVNGAQVAGLFNTASKRANGVQIAGLFNIAQEVNGAQIAGLFNCAKKVKGAQIGVINVAEESDGIAIGVFNFIKDGMHHIGFNWDTNDRFDWFIQSGTKHLFITIGDSFDRSDISKTDIDYNNLTQVFYAGIGSEFRFWFSSIDFEVLQKLVVCPSLYPQTKEEFKDFNFSEYIIPSFRVTWNIISGNVIDLGIGASFDLYIQNKNEQAFALTNHKNGIKGDHTILYPSYFFGFKIK